MPDTPDWLADAQWATAAPTPPAIPDWAWGVVKGTPLAHVNRRYHWHMGQLRGLRIRCSAVRDRRHREALERILWAEERRVADEFTTWKRTNGYA